MSEDNLKEELLKIAGWEAFAKRRKLASDVFAEIFNEKLNKYNDLPKNSPEDKKVRDEYRSLTDALENAQNLVIKECYEDDFVTLNNSIQRLIRLLDKNDISQDEFEKTAKAALKVHKTIL